MLPGSKVASDFVVELTLFRYPAKLLQAVKREGWGMLSSHFCRTSLYLREVSAGHWGTERGTS